MTEARNDKRIDDIVESATKELTDKGLLVAAGFEGLRAQAIPKDAPQVQIDEMRSAFFAGAAHLFHSVMTVMESGEEPTANDMRRMEMIEKELQGFLAEYQKRHHLADEKPERSSPEKPKQAERLGDAPIEHKYHERMNELAHFLDHEFNGDRDHKTTGFILLVFPFEDHGRCNYISNSRRADVIVLLKEQLARFEGMPEAEGRG